MDGKEQALRKPKAPMPAEFVQDKRKARMAKIDRLHPELRKLVHEYGWPTVYTLMSCGVVAPSRIRHIVETILNEFSPTRGSFSMQGPSSQHFAAKKMTEEHVAREGYDP